MPTYTYTCKECKTYVNRFVLPSKNKELGPPTCECGEEMKPQFGSPQIMWKGPGGTILDPEMNETEAEDALYREIEETYDDE